MLSGLNASEPDWPWHFSGGLLTFIKQRWLDRDILISKRMVFVIFLTILNFKVV
jgi:hypothetical protein